MGNFTEASFSKGSYISIGLCGLILVGMLAVHGKINDGYLESRLAREASTQNTRATNKLEEAFRRFSERMESNIVQLQLQAEALKVQVKELQNKDK